jgi:hypothetical protein
MNYDAGSFFEKGDTSIYRLQHYMKINYLNCCQWQQFISHPVLAVSNQRNGFLSITINL